MNEKDLMFATISFDVEYNISEDDLNDILLDYFCYEEMFEVKKLYNIFRVEICISDIDCVKETVIEVLNKIEKFTNNKNSNLWNNNFGDNISLKSKIVIQCFNGEKLTGNFLFDEDNYYHDNSEALQCFISDCGKELPLDYIQKWCYEEDLIKQEEGE